MASWLAMTKRPRSYNHLGSNEGIYYFAAHDKQPPSQKAEPILDSDCNSSTSSTIAHRTWQSDSAEKLPFVSASILTLLASISLLVLTVTDSRSTGPLLTFVRENRPTAQVIVSAVAALLASLNVYTATKLLNLATRIHMLQNSLSLNTIKLIEAVATSRWVTGLPVTMSTMSAMIVLLFALPSVLWTGALTPVLANATIVKPSSLKIPQYSTSSNTTWSNNGRIWHEECSSVTNQMGIFSDCPVDTIQSSLLSRAAQATSNLTQVHSKNDNSHYSYVGRSYGVGSSAGLVDANLGGGPNGYSVLSYNYTEPGYMSHVTCFHNASSAFHLEEIQAGKPENGIPSIYYATGLFPNAAPGSSPDFFSVVGLSGDVNIAVLAAKPYQGRNIILITAGSEYSILNGTQCEIVFSPTLFTVGVDVVKKLIYVLPVTTAATAAGSFSASFDPTAGLAHTTVDQLNGLGMISTSLYTSIVGDSLISNIAAATSNDTTPSAAGFAAVEDSFSAMVDDILLFVGSTQFFMPNAGAGDFSTVDANLTVQAIQIGEARYVYATFGTCVMLLLAVAAEACRTKAWKWLPKWDLTDLTCLVLASAVAGEDVVAEMCQGREGRQVEWSGGGNGGVAERGGQGQREGVGGGGTQEKAPDLRLRLGRKVGYWNGTEDVMGAQDVQQLAAVSLWTSGAKGVLPLK